MNNSEKAKKVKEKLDKISDEKKMDLSSDQDLSLALMNLISIEEHFIFTGSKTEKSKYYDLANEVREIRKKLLKEIVTDYEGEVWCISKHLLAGSMRLMEVGTKQLDQGNKKKANEMFDHSYSLYSLFWAVNDDSFNLKELNQGVEKGRKESDKKEENKKEPLKDGREDTFLFKLKEKVSSLVDCCRE